MSSNFFSMTGMISAVLCFLAGFGVSIWIGVAALVPEAPWEQRNIMAGVLIIVFGTLIGVITGFIGGLCCGGCCVLVDESDEW